MRFTAIIFFLGFFSCCTNPQENIITGDLYFSDFRIGSYYNLDDSTKTQFEIMLDTTKQHKADSNTIKLINAYQSLKDQRLLYKPFIDLKTGEESYVKLYMDSSDYERVKIYHRQELIDEGKKVIIKARIRRVANLGFPLLYCEYLEEITLVDGETLLKESKFRIDDYH